MRHLPRSRLRACDSGGRGVRESSSICSKTWPLTAQILASADAKVSLMNDPSKGERAGGNYLPRSGAHSWSVAQGGKDASVVPV